MVLLFLIILCFPLYQLNFQEDLSYLNLIQEKNKIMHAIAVIESNDGKNINHVVMPNNSFAIGKYALMPSTIKYVLKKNNEFIKYRYLIKMSNVQLKKNLNKDSILNEKLAYCYYDMLTKLINTKDPVYISYAWLNGPYKTIQMIKQKKNISHHWHVKKMLMAYNKI